MFVDDASASGLKHVEPDEQAAVHPHERRGPFPCARHVQVRMARTYVFILRAMWLFIEPTRE